MKPQDTDPYTDPECYGDDLGVWRRPFYAILAVVAVVLVALIVWTWPR
jgi:hypothetical protein